MNENNVLPAARAPYGRKQIPVNEELFAELVKQWQAGEITAREAYTQLGMTSRTFYRNAQRRGYSAHDRQPLKQILIPITEYYRLKKAAGEQ